MSWGRPGVILSHLGASLEPVWVILEVLLVVLGCLGRFGGCPGDILGTSWAVLGASQERPERVLRVQDGPKMGPR